MTTLNDNQFVSDYVLCQSFEIELPYVNMTGLAYYADECLNK
jgi:hypothetical protein